MPPQAQSFASSYEAQSEAEDIDASIDDSLRSFMDSVLKAHSKPGAVAKKLLEDAYVAGGGNYQNFANSGQHEDADGIVNHRLVVKGQNLL